MWVGLVCGSGGTEWDEVVRLDGWGWVGSG